MGEALFDHLWQSTLCAVAAGLLVLAFRKDQASIRFVIWFAASAKFLVPFSLLVWIGGLLSSKAPAMLQVDASFAAAMERIARPAAMLMSNFAVSPLGRAPGQSLWSGWAIAFLIWLLGVIVLICRRTVQWLHLLAITRASTPLDIDAPIPVRETTSNLEPGVFGIVSPTVLVPAGITSQLTTPQLSAILAHELCHWRRRDNLTAAIHTLVETLVWFHPVVWWLGGLMVAERERACDEAVIQSGNDRHTYAEGILRVCRLYVATPLWSAGVSGGVLRKRIEEIMQNAVLVKLSLAKKSLLAFAAGVALIAPIAAGLWGGSGVARADEADSSAVKHYSNGEWKFALDIPRNWIPSNWVAMPPRSGSTDTPGPRMVTVMTFGANISTDRLLILSHHTYDPGKETLKTILDSAEHDMPRNGFVHFVPGEPTTIGSKRAIRLDFERAPKDGEGIWYCRTYYIVGSKSAYILAFGARNIAAAQRDAVFATYDRMAESFVFEDL
jgi:beta-lactamase regulating signal transducer with metallopeptidase domain